MVKLLIAFACFLPMLLQAQGFGSYTFDQPFLAKDTATLTGLKSGLVAYWTLDEASNSTREDSTAADRDLFDQDANVTSTATGAKYGNAALFGADERNKLETSGTGSDAFGGNGTFTVALWAKCELEDSLNPIIARYDVTGWGVWSLFIYESRLKTIFVAPGGTWYSLTNYATGVYLNSTLFYAFGYDAATGKGWTSTNGVVIGETDALSGGLTNVSAGSLQISVGNWSGLDNAWHGLIDEAGYWNRRLSTNELSDLYNSGTGLTYTNFP